MEDAVIIDAMRTPVGRFGGVFKDVPVQKLGSLVIKRLLNNLELNPVSKNENYISNLNLGEIELEERYHDYSGTEIEIDEVFMGNVLQAALGQNPARQASIYAGIPKETPATTINKVCGSGLKALALAASSIRGKDNNVVIAGGMESMSDTPYAMTGARWGMRMFNSEVIDLMVNDGLWETFYGYHMGYTAENLADLYKVSREEQDELAYQSHKKAIKATDDQIFTQEIAPVSVKQKKQEIEVHTDEHPRRDTTIEKLAKLPPAFKKGGTVTAGNSSGINDGAAAMLLASSRKADELGLKPAVRVVSYASGAIDPAYMGLGVVPAIMKALEKANLRLDDIDLIELNEAFAAQIISVMKELELDTNDDRLNVHGSGISMGHPIGATGARITTTLLKEMQRRRARYGLAALCIGGGMGFAMIFEKV
ncbi:MAG: acetyl-CoA C-acetyltransferase [Archaeoglobaceae archaeon]